MPEETKDKSAEYNKTSFLGQLLQKLSFAISVGGGRLRGGQRSAQANGTSVT